MKRLGALEYRNDSLAVSSSGYSAANFVDSANEALGGFWCAGFLSPADVQVTQYRVRLYGERCSPNTPTAHMSVGSLSGVAHGYRRTHADGDAISTWRWPWTDALLCPPSALLRLALAPMPWHAPPGECVPHMHQGKLFAL